MLSLINYHVQAIMIYNRFFFTVDAVAPDSDSFRISYKYSMIRIRRINYIILNQYVADGLACWMVM